MEKIPPESGFDKIPTYDLSFEHHFSNAQSNLNNRSNLMSLSALQIISLTGLHNLVKV